MPKTGISVNSTASGNRASWPQQCHNHTSRRSSTPQKCTIRTAPHRTSAWRCMRVVLRCREAPPTRGAACLQIGTCREAHMARYGLFCSRPHGQIRPILQSPQDSLRQCPSQAMPVSDMPRLRHARLRQCPSQTMPVSDMPVSDMPVSDNAVMRLGQPVMRLGQPVMRLGQPVNNLSFT